MKKLIYISVFLFSLSGTFSGLFACSCIYLRTSNHIIFGRNHDYYNPNSLIIYNPKNIFKSGIPFPGENIPKWKSVYSSITISLLGVGYANSGMNEKGLTIGYMTLTSVYPAKDDRPEISDTQWIQYMLDKCANTNEVIEEAKKIRITKGGGSCTHYFVGDAEGNATTIEFINGQMVVHTNKDMPYMLLSNDTYEKSMNDIKSYIGFGGDKIIPERAIKYDELFPTEVMAIGCSKMNQFYKKESKNIIQDAFDIQYAMRGPDTTYQNMEACTQYSVIFDITNMKIYFRTKANQTIREIDFKSFKDDCSVKAKMLDIQTTGIGNVNNLFVDYSTDENRKAIDRSFSREPYKIPKEMVDFNQQYIDSFGCEK